MNDKIGEFYLNNPSLPTERAQFEWTPEMLKDVTKCNKDIIYFAEKYFYIINLDRGKEIIKLYKAQKRILKSLTKNNRVALLASRQSGKALALDTPIPTPSGWTTMGELKDGNKVYDESGNICTVKKAHDILHNRDCYKVTFDNDDSIVCDGEHLWFTQTHYDRRHGCNGTVKTTKTIMDDLYRKSFNKKKNKEVLEPNHRIPKCGGVSGIKTDLTIDPYLLGVWLGDGHSAGSRISVGKQDIVEISKLLNQNFYSINDDGHGNFNYNVKGATGTKIGDCFTKHLRTLNLLNNKHIPNNYMLADRSSRLELLKGLMDTDGTISKDGSRCYINSSYPTLAQDIESLILSLGYKVSKRTNKARKSTHRDSIELSFTAEEQIFKLSRKASRYKPIAKISRTQYHYIKKIEKVDSVPVRCITVDSPNNLYLCGKTYIPTHNTTMISIFALWYICFNADKTILIVANKEKTAIEILGRVRTSYELLPNWLKPGVKDYSKTNMVLSNDSRIFVSTTASTAARGSSINCLLIEECAHIDKFKEEEFFNSVMPVISSSKNSKIFMISTAKGTANKFYQIYSAAERNENEWKSEKVHWSEVPGRDEQWKKNALSDLGGDLQNFAQEYENVFIETGETAVDKDIIATFRSIAKKPEIVNSPEYKVWEPPNKKNIYVFGVDVSDGVGGAASCIQCLDVTDLTNIKQVMCYWNKFLDTTHFAQEIFNLAVQWGKPYLAIERNSMGGEVLSILSRQPYNYDRIISYSSDQHIDYEKLGINSSTNVKYEGVSNMRYWMNSVKAVELYDLATIQEIETFVKYANGTWHKQPGANILDDRVMALCWALFTLTNTIAENIYEIVKYDEHGKPLKLKKSDYDDDQVYYGLKSYKNFWSDDEFVPSFIGIKTGASANTELEDMKADGWTQFNPF